MPYSSLPPTAFWRSGVQLSDPLDMVGIYKKKFEICRTDKIATAGSCFAQHIATNLRSNGYTVLNQEPCPSRELSLEESKRFGYNLYSARHGNIYSSRQFLQLLREARGQFVPADIAWVRDGRFYDALRPSVEPEGLETAEEVAAHRKVHLTAVNRIITSADVFVFTLGLTEAWMHTESGTVYPTAPGTIAGTFDPKVFSFKNFTSAEVLDDLRQVRRLLKRYNPSIRLLLTVSPVPLTATRSGNHVAVATSYSKAALRVAAGEFADQNDDVDYFPSYEIVTNPAARGRFYNSNLRSVTNEGVASVMRVFFQAHNGPTEADLHNESILETLPSARSISDEDDDVICEEMLLDAFSGR